MRFRVTHLLLLLTVTAVSTCVVRDAVTWSRAQEKFDLATAFVRFGQIKLIEIEPPARELLERESGTLWISRRQAKSNYVERINEIIENEENEYWLRCAPEVLEDREAQVAELKSRLQEVIGEED
jgi:hypothetical protein